MMTSIIAVLFLSMMTAGISCITKQRMERCLPMTICLAVCWLYICYCLQLLWAGLWLFCGVSAILFAWNGWKNKSAFSKIILTPGFVLWLGICAVFVVIFSGNRANLWDELRLWAAVPKAMYELGSLQLGSDSPIFSTMQSYPPGLPLLCYFFTAFGAEYCEGALYVAYACATMAFLMPAFKTWQWKSWELLAPVALVVYALPFVFTSHFGDACFFGMSLFVDPILGVIAGYAFYLVSSKPFRDRFSLIQFSLALMVLALLKSTGIVFAGCILVCAFFLERKPRLSWLLPILALALGFGSWKLLLNHYDIHALIPLNLHLLDGEEISNLLHAMTSINIVLYSLPLGPLLSFAVIYPLMWLVYFLAAKHLHKGTIKQEIAVAMFMILSMLLFVYGYAAIYARTLESFPRYMCTPLLCLGSYLVLREVPLASAAKLSHQIKPGFAKGLAAGCLAIALGVTVLWQSIYPVSADLDQADQYTQAIRQAVLEDEAYQSPARIYLVMAGPGTSSLYHHRIFCSLISQEMNLFNQPFRTRVVDPDITDPVQSWAQELKAGFDYVYVLSVEEALVPVFLEFAEEPPQAETLYRVEPAETILGVQLIPVI